MLLKAFCEFSQHLARLGKDPLSITKNLFPTSEPIESLLIQAMAKSYDCAAKGSVYNIVDTTNTLLVVVDVPDWASSNPCKGPNSNPSPSPGPGPAADALRFTDKNICNLIEFPNFLDPFDDNQVKNFLKSFQNQVTSLAESMKNNQTNQLN